ncbi:hypothetical protein AGMMS49959_17500 [Planctomycetales bacterium]|nr:hypothetical protein AGMMS49959_17500 [Planctomycetales bacterium]
MSWLAAKQTAALVGVVKLVKQTVRDLGTNGEPVPSPLSLQKFSGKLVIPTTPKTHRLLVLRALENGVSLRTYLFIKISCNWSRRLIDAQGKENPKLSDLHRLAFAALISQKLIKR